MHGSWNAFAGRLVNGETAVEFSTLGARATLTTDIIDVSYPWVWFPGHIVQRAPTIEPLGTATILTPFDSTTWVIILAVSFGFWLLYAATISIACSPARDL
jgi:hypothetical protein